MKNLATIFSLFLLITQLKSQEVSIKYFKDSQFFKPTTEKKARFKITTEIIGPMTKISKENIKSGEVLNELTFKTNDSANFWRDKDYGKYEKTISTQTDSILEIKIYRINNDSLIGTVRYKTKYSRLDSIELKRIELNHKLIKSGSKKFPESSAELNYTPAVFYNNKVSFHEFLKQNLVFYKKTEFDLGGEEIQSKTTLIRIHIDEEGNPNDIYILQGFGLYFDMACYMAAIKSPKWTSPAVKNGKPIKSVVNHRFTMTFLPAIFEKE